jgi:hypothetical protein
MFHSRVHVLVNAWLARIAGIPGRTSEHRVVYSMCSEDLFIAGFSQAKATGLTYADYMQLDKYYFRQVAHDAPLSAATARLLHGPMGPHLRLTPRRVQGVNRPRAREGWSVRRTSVSLTAPRTDARAGR